jgi:hypothetical protein
VADARIVLGLMFVAARNRNEPVALVRFAGEAPPFDAGVEIERATMPSTALALRWLARAQRARDATEDVRYAVRFFDHGGSVGTYGLPDVERLPATTHDEALYEEDAREVKEEGDRLRAVAAQAYRAGQARARGKR